MCVHLNQTETLADIQSDTDLLNIVFTPDLMELKIKIDICFFSHKLNSVSSIYIKTLLRPVHTKDDNYKDND